ncbi:MAG: riboflavin synthase subunit alpha [Candidatus Dasytiphilus stammeri]
MFTGIIQGIANVLKIKQNQELRTYIIRLPAEMLVGLKSGMSVANNGCCLTIAAINHDQVRFDLIKETLSVTNLRELKPGDQVNVERAAKLGDEIGGHLISGHIMTTAEIIKIIHIKNHSELWFKLRDESVCKYIRYKGFIAIDGISLTIGSIKDNQFGVHLIPETIARTTLGSKRLTNTVNIEIDFYTKTIIETVESLCLEKYLTTMPY